MNSYTCDNNIINKFIIDYFNMSTELPECGFSTYVLLGLLFLSEILSWQNKLKGIGGITRGLAHGSHVLIRRLSFKSDTQDDQTSEN